MEWLAHFQHWCSGRSSDRPEDGLKPVLYTQSKNAVAGPAEAGPLEDQGGVVGRYVGSAFSRTYGTVAPAGGADALTA